MAYIPPRELWLEDGRKFIMKDMGTFRMDFDLDTGAQPVVVTEDAVRFLDEGDILMVLQPKPDSP